MKNIYVVVNVKNNKNVLDNSSMVKFCSEVCMPLLSFSQTVKTLVLVQRLILETCYFFSLYTLFKKKLRSVLKQSTRVQHMVFKMIQKISINFLNPGKKYQVGSVYQFVLHYNVC